MTQWPAKSEQPSLSACAVAHQPNKCSLQRIVPVNTASTSTVPTATDSLSNWLQWLESIHPVEIELGLDRVRRVAERMQLQVLNAPLILVAGTNGKGSTVALLEQIYLNAGYSVGAYTSPHIHKFNERIRVDGFDVSDEAIIEALIAIEAQRKDDSLTYFEYTTLAAMYIFRQHRCAVLLLEVGLGGRLDACNLWDADVSIVTSIALDHAAFLGNDRAVVATEKAAIGRPGMPLIVGDTDPPKSLFELVKERGMLLIHVGVWTAGQLPQLRLAGEHQQRNAACALAAIDVLANRLPVSASAIREALDTVVVAGRFDVLEYEGVTVVLDVAHNPAAAEALANTWQSEFGKRAAHAVFAVLADKDIEHVVAPLVPYVRHWFCVQLDVPRATPVAQLTELVNACASNDSIVTSSDSVAAGFHLAHEHALDDGLPVLVCGSFHVLEALPSAVFESVRG